MKVLSRTRFGNPILRGQARQLSKKEITSSFVKSLIADMQYTLKNIDVGVGLAAPQVNEPLALAVIRIRPKKYRPDVKTLDLVIINPQITATSGRRKQMWEGCISSSAKDAAIFAKVPRYETIKLRYRDQKAKLHNQTFDGLVAHVIQHEVDHLNGILFVDKVKDTHSYMTFSEYKKMLRREAKNGK